MQWLFILMLGLTCTVGGSLWGLKRWRLRRNGARAVGIVAELSTDMDIPRTHRPIVEFKTDTGQTIRFRGSTGSSSPSYRQGQSVRVIYSRQSPWNAQIDNIEQLWLGPVSVTLFGLIALVAVLLFGEY